MNKPPLRSQEVGVGGGRRGGRCGGWAGREGGAGRWGQVISKEAESCSDQSGLISLYHLIG